MKVRCETANGIARIELARPERKNAIDTEMYGLLAQAIEAAGRDEDVRALVLHGSPEVFCAGNDIQDFLDRPPASADSTALRFMRALADQEKPVIAAVNGAAVGIGATLLMHCDLVICADNAMFSMPFVSLGLCPEFASSLLLPLSAGYHKAAEKILFGEPISAEEALDMGLVNRLVPPAQVLEVALHQARRFLALPPAAVRASKRLLKAPWRAAVDQAMGAEFESFRERLASEESREALRAFLERRKPDFAHAATRAPGAGQ